MRYLSFVFGIFSLVCVLPLTSEAYTTTGVEQFSLDGKVSVFVVDYRFGHEKYDLTMPLHAVRKTTDDVTALTYEILDGNGNPGKGEAFAVILSDATLADETYHTEKGSARSFRLLVLYKRTDEEGGQVFRTQVTHLPFAFTGVQDLSLTPSELTKYTTLPLPLLLGATMFITKSRVK